MGSSDDIIALAEQSGIPFKVGSTFRRNAVTLSGSPSWHASDNAVDFTGESQDELAQYFMSKPTHEVIHHSKATGRNYATSDGKPFTLSGALLNQHIGHLHVASDEQLLAGQPGLSARTGGFDPSALLPGWVTLPQNLTDATQNVAASLAGAAKAAGSVAKAADLIVQAFTPGNLLRGASFGLGTIFLLIGIWFLAREVKESQP